MTMPRLLSLGKACQTAYQIRRISKREEAQFFDWFIIDYESVLSVLEADMAGVFDRENLVVAKDQKSVYDKRFRITSFHDFGHDAQGLTTEAQVAAKYDAVQQKFKFLADRWRSVIASGEPVVFVHHGDISQDGLADLPDRFDRLYPGLSYRFLWVRWPGAAPRQDVAKVIRAEVREAEKGPHQWAGRNEDWDIVFGNLMQNA